jgi:hypothetical protein
MTILRDSLRSIAAGEASHRMSPIYVTCGSMLCELRIWTTTELPESKEVGRSVALTRIPGLGWIGAVPVECMS